MAQDNSTPARHTINSTQRNVRSQDDVDAELLAYYEEKRKTGRSDEWIACLDATIRQLRHS